MATQKEAILKSVTSIDGYVPEDCWVYSGRYDGEVDVNETEIAEWRYIDIASLESEMASSPESFTPWLKMEWAQIANSHLDAILQSS